MVVAKVTGNETPEELYDQLIKELDKYHPSKDYTLVDKAYNLAREAHGEQLRKSGEPYIIHPLSVAIILAELKLDIESICAGLLHDVIEDTKYTYEDMENMFSSDIAKIVDGVTKLESLQSYSDGNRDREQSKREELAENYRKMFLATAKDMRVIIIKIADRLHNMRTLKYMSREKQIIKAQETHDIYAPIAQRLSINKLRYELEDLSFRYLEPEQYADIARQLELKKSERESQVNDIIAELEAGLKEANIDAKVKGRPKHLFSIYKKMKKDNKTLDQVYDLLGFRIFVETIPECYAAFGVAQGLYMSIPGRFKDYISMPKPNGYMSLHNTVLAPDGKPFEIQIRTYDMHRISEYGIAAHWKYKTGKSGEVDADKEAEKLDWLKELSEKYGESESEDSEEYLETLKQDLDLYADKIFCYSPNGEVIELPVGSCTIDFAYAIHSEVGNTLIGALVNDVRVSINTELKSGDIVEIVRSKNSRGPSRDWLNTVKTPQARSKINQWFKQQNKAENVTRGTELLELEAKRKGYTLEELMTPSGVELVLNKYAYKDWEGICASVGFSGIKEGQIINRLIEEYKSVNEPKVISNTVAMQLLQDHIIETEQKDEIKDKNKRKKKSKSGVIIKGLGHTPVTYAKCCTPIPGDDVVVYITRGRGVMLHRKDCINIVNLPEEEKGRTIEANWTSDLFDSTTPTDSIEFTKPDTVKKQRVKEKEKYDIKIKVVALDSDGLLNQFSKILTDEKIEIKSFEAKTVRDNAVFTAVIRVYDIQQYNYIVRKIKKINDVISVDRINV